MHLVNTKCAEGHARRALCCKMAKELEMFLNNQKKYAKTVKFYSKVHRNINSEIFFFSFYFRWFCHFDDDNYVNVPKLKLLLSEYNSSLDWYLGKPSTATPIEINLSKVIY